MKKEPQPDSDLILYQTEDGRTRRQVRLEGETVWLTQQLMAELFQTTQQNVSLHLQNIFEEGELSLEATHKEFLSVRQEGARQVSRKLDNYNLDAIISVGYRVKSQRGGIRTFRRPPPRRTGSPRRSGSARAARRRGEQAATVQESKASAIMSRRYALHQL